MNRDQIIVLLRACQDVPSDELENIFDRFIRTIKRRRRWKNFWRRFAFWRLFMPPQNRHFQMVVNAVPALLIHREGTGEIEDHHAIIALQGILLCNRAEVVTILNEARKKFPGLKIIDTNETVPLV